MGLPPTSSEVTGCCATPESAGAATQQGCGLGALRQATRRARSVGNGTRGLSLRERAAAAIQWHCFLEPPDEITLFMRMSATWVGTRPSSAPWISSQMGYRILSTSSTAAQPYCRIAGYIAKGLGSVRFDLVRV